MLHKIVRCLLIVAILLPVLSAQRTVQAGCAAPIIPGDWHTQPGDPVKYVMAVNVPLKGLPGLNFVGTVTITSDVSLNVNCDGSLTGSFSNFIYDFKYTAAGQPGSCHGGGSAAITAGKVVAGDGGQPLFQLDQTNYTPAGDMICSPGGAHPESASSGSYVLQATSSAGNTVSSDKFSGDKDPFYNYLKLLGMSDNLVDYSSGTNLTVGWTLYNDADLPVVTDAKEQYDQYFLQGINAPNELTATIDWKQGTPDKVNFVFQGNTVSIQTSGTTAQWPFNMANLQAGKNPVSITATDAKGLTSPEYLFNYYGVAVPDWAKPANLGGSEQGTNVLYSGQLKFPQKPFSKMISLPSAIPLIGGNWGITPIQFTASLQANSSGAETTGPVTGTGGLAFAGDEKKLNTTGQLATQLDEQTLELLPADSYANLDFDPGAYTKQIGAIQLVPGLSSLFGIPVVGNLLKAINSIVSLNVNVHPSLAGKGNIGLDPNTDTLTFTGGQATNNLIVSLLTSINIGLANAYAEGGGHGTLGLNLTSPVSVTDCTVKLFFSAGAGVAGVFGGQTYGPYTKDWEVLPNQCGPAAMLGTKVSASAVFYPSAGPLRVSARPQGWQPETPVLRNSQKQNITETVLAENANPDAAPRLAAAPDGRLALVWMTETAAKPRPQGLEIMARLFDGQAWGQPIAVTSDNNLDTVPAAGFDANGQLVLVWMRNKAGNLAPDTAFDATLARQFEIAYAVVGKDGKLGASGTLTNDDVFDFNPQIGVGSDGTVWAVWQASPGSDMLGTQTAPNKLLAARWDGKGWSPVETVSDRLAGTLFWRVAVNRADDVRVAADQDTDGNLATAGDREIMLYTRGSQGWTGTQITHNQVADTAPLLTFVSGQLSLAWLSGNQLVGVNGDPTQTPQTWLDQNAAVSASIGSGSLVGLPNGRLALVWSDNSEHGSDVWLSQRQPDGSWSAPQPQFNAADQRKSVTAAAAPNGDLVLGLARVKTLPQQVKLSDGSSLSIQTPAPGADLEVARITGSQQAGGIDWKAWHPIFGWMLACSFGALLLASLATLAYWFLRYRPAARL